MLHALSPGAGHRRLNERAVEADRLATSFAGLPDGVTHRHVLTAFKRAAPYLGIPPRLVHAIDTMMAWSRGIDWTPGQRPIVFPSNEKLAQKLGVGVRQVQKLLNHAVARRLITHRDSANGNRIGARDGEGRLVYAYGIDLSPLAARHDEFVRAADRGVAEDRRIDVLRKRLTAARRRIRSLAQIVIDEEMDVDAATQVEIAQLATRQTRNVRDEVLLTACVEQIERRSDELGQAVRNIFAKRQHPDVTQNNSPSDEFQGTHNTTTSQPYIAKAYYRRRSSEKCSEGYDVRTDRPQTEVEADLEKHGVDPDFIVDVVPELVPVPGTDRPSWGHIIEIAERLIDQAGVQRGIWHDACRLMGQKGAAASVIATACKHLRGDVDRPGAYLRGMNGRAADGMLNLARTFHGLKDDARNKGMRSLATGSEPRSIGQLAAAALRRARASSAPARLL